MGLAVDRVRSGAPRPLIGYFRASLEQSRLAGPRRRVHLRSCGRPFFSSKIRVAWLCSPPVLTTARFPLGDRRNQRLVGGLSANKKLSTRAIGFRVARHSSKIALTLPTVSVIGCSPDDPVDRPGCEPQNVVLFLSVSYVPFPSFSAAFVKWDGLNRKAARRFVCPNLSTEARHRTRSRNLAAWSAPRTRFQSDGTVVAAECRTADTGACHNAACRHNRAAAIDTGRGFQARQGGSHVATGSNARCQDRRPGCDRKAYSGRCHSFASPSGAARPAPWLARARGEDGQ